MIVRHATPVKNLDSIESTGIDPARSRGKLRVGWLHTPSKTSWAILHTVARHGGAVQDVVVIECDVPRSWLVRRRAGLYSCDRIIPPCRMRRVIRFGEVSATPIREAA